MAQHHTQWRQLTWKIHCCSQVYLISIIVVVLIAFAHVCQSERIDCVTESCCWNWKTIFSVILVTAKQIERLYSRFTSLDRNDSGTLSREDFLRIPELAINPLCERIVHSFFADSNDDRVNFRQFTKVLATFRTIKKSQESTLNSREEKLRCELTDICCDICAFLTNYS